MMEKGDIKDVMISLEDFRQLNLKNEINRIASKIKLLKLHPDSPKELEKVYNIIYSLVVNPDLTIQEVFDFMNINKES